MATQYVTTRQWATRSRQYEIGDLVSITSIRDDERIEGITTGALVPARFVDTAANMAARNPIPGPGVVCYETDTYVTKIGDGTTAYTSLPNALSGTYEPIGGTAVRVPLPRAYKKIAAMNAGIARFKMLALGDSYAQKVASPVFTTLAPLMGGIAGGYLADGAGAPLQGQMQASATTGTTSNPLADFDIWPSGVNRTISGGGTVTYAGSGSTVMTDTFKVYVANEPAGTGGTFKLQIDGSDASGFTNVSNVGALGTLTACTVTTTRAAHNIKVVNLTGRQRIVCTGWEDSTKSGLVSMVVGQAGIDYSSATTTAWSNFQAFLADALPDLMLVECKENAAASWATTLASMFAATAGGAPNMDVVGIGSPPVSANDAAQVAQNAALKVACATAGYTFYDTYALFGSYAKLTALGWNGDGTHVSVTADEYRAALMLRDTGLLTAYGRGMAAGTARASQVRVARTVDQAGGGANPAIFGTSEHVIRPEASFGFDLQVVPGRWLSFMANDGATEMMRLDGLSGGTTSFLPSGIRLGNQATAPMLIHGTGNGAPEGAVTAPIGSIYLRFDAGVASAVYVKESGTGNTGWAVLLASKASGSATLVGGTVTVSNASITANSVIRLANGTRAGTPGAIYVSALNAGVGFTVTSTSGTDTGTFRWDVVSF